MSAGIESWHWECTECGYEKADFKPTINESFAYKQIDEDFRKKGLQKLRIKNFNKLLKAIVSSGQDSGQLLDVGCAHGWFLEAAQKRGFNVLGIEPDLKVFKETLKRGLPIRQGLFPQALEADEQFDVIVFNDVFEHIPDLSVALKESVNHLKPEGVLVLNLPSTLGFFYKIAKFLHKLGINSFFDRLWQKGYPSPHIHFFNPNNLQLLLRSNGLAEVKKGRLSSLRLNGLFARVSHTGAYSIPVSMIITFLAIFAIPILRLMPSDIIYTICKKSK